ncbi:MAG: VOC family protein [Bdellovibrionales bacterium]|nr:VOC family protein [Bdellovibrionales bacterium]
MKAKLKMNHLSFPQQEAVKEARFFEEYFGAKIEFFDEASKSVLIKHGDIDIVMEGTTEPVEWHKDFHFGFELETKKEVVNMFEKLKCSSATIETEVHNRAGRGSRFFGRTPGGVQFEINTREDMESKWKVKTQNN